MFRYLSSLFYSIINTIIPPRGSERLVAALTLADLEYLRTSPLRQPADDGGLPYHDKSVTALIWELKYNRSSRALLLAGEFLAEELLGIAEDELGRPLLIPIPMHKSRRRERGHNQTELLCEAALKYIGASFDYAPHVLTRTRNDAPQQGLPRRTRLENVKGSMQADSAKVKGRVCVVVDDVATTGATLEEAARALKKAGARRVHTVTLAKS